MALVKYWCMLKRNEVTSSLSGTVEEIMTDRVSGQEIPRCCASSNAWITHRGKEEEEEKKGKGKRREKKQEGEGGGERE